MLDCIDHCVPSETLGTDSRLAARSAPLRYVPVGTMNLWSLRVRLDDTEAGEEGFPRTELIDGSSFFIVRSFPSRLAFEDRYYDLG